MAGHSKWANIKHRKARQDAKRSRMWSKCARAIIVAARNGGGDPAANLALRYAIDEAKAVNMPKDTIENAIRKGTGDAGGQAYEQVVYEGYGPNGVAVMLDVLTDNRNRTVGEIRKIFEKRGGKLGTSGCVAFLFHPKGVCYVSKAVVDEETLMSAALDAGAEDVADQDESWEVVCDPPSFLPVQETLKEAGITIESASLTMFPDNTVTCTGEDARRVLTLIEELDEHEDVQKVHSNFEIPDEEMAAMQ